MDNKTLLAIVLSALVIIGFQYFVAPQHPVAPRKAPVEQPAQPKEVGPQPVTAAPEAPLVPAAGEKEIRVETDLYKAVLSSRGGTIKSWEIKPYKDKAGNEVVLLKKPGVLPALAAGGDDGFELAYVNFGVSGGDLRLGADDKQGVLVFEYSGGGQFMRRTYTFHADTYTVDISDEVSGVPAYWISLGSDFGLFEKADRSAHVGPVVLQGTDLKELKEKKLVEPNVFKDDVKWIAQEDKYFFSALVPQTKTDEARAWKYKDSPVVAFKGKPGVNKFTLYAGPKEHDRLEQLHVGLEYIIDYGFFSVIARPLFWFLKVLYRIFGNYGWAIVALTIVVRIPFIPLVSKGQKSMRKLQEMQPKMNEVREKFKKDPQRMQAEMMELYKKHKVNPVGGCLPMILQIPVFFALYKVLAISIELRGAPFMLWIVDLSLKDPYYVLPVVMGVTTLLQQKMTPSTMDPKQAKLMMFMPVVFTFMFLNFASGLVLYWLVNNLLSIIQQLYINRSAAKQPAA